MDTVALISVTLLVVFVSKLLISTLVELAWRPYVITKKFEAQGIRGPGYKFLMGSVKEMRAMSVEGEAKVMDVRSSDYMHRVHPFFLKYIAAYGKTFLYWLGPQPVLCLGDINLVKTVLLERTGLYPKNEPPMTLMAMLGKGLVFAEGEDWARHRRVVHPSFGMEKIKMMTTTIVGCAEAMAKQWEGLTRVDEITGDKVAEIDIRHQAEEIMTEIISRTAFGSNFEEGYQAYFTLQEIDELLLISLFQVPFPGRRFLPTSNNRKNWRLSKKVKSMLTKIIQARLDSKEADGSHGQDLLGMMLDACTQDRNSDRWMSMDDIIDECKTFFFAGQDTTTNLFSWTIYLLCVNPQWQDRLREEIVRECGTHVRSADELNNLKLVNMVLLEVLRMYAPVVLIMRKAAKDLSLAGIDVPKGTGLTIPISLLHRDKDVWGDDADEFNPLRFEKGVSQAAKVPNALVSFSQGPRACIGQNFGLLEVKSVLATVLLRFSFSLSPKYVHAPVGMITLQPKYGVPVIIRSLDV